MDPPPRRPLSCPFRVPPVTVALSSGLFGRLVHRVERARFSCPLLFHWSHPAFQRVSPFHPIKLCNSLFIAFWCNYSIIGLSLTHSFTMKAASYRADISQILSIPVCALTRLSIWSTTRPQCEENTPGLIYSFTTLYSWDADRWKCLLSIWTLNRVKIHLLLP